MGMPTPEDNADGYKRAWLSILPNEFKNKTYLLAHGTLDDNVHYQQSMHLIRALELYDIPFEQIVSQTSTIFTSGNCSLNVFFLDRPIQTKIIHWAAYEDIFSTLSINISANVLKKQLKFICYHRILNLLIY